MKDKFVDLDKIFQSFSKEEDDEGDLLIDFSGHPLFWISFFNKIIKNRLFIRLWFVEKNNITKNIPVEELEEAGDKIMFEKAWFYIKNISIDNQFHIECIKLKASNEFLNNVKETLLYFEELEEYEKCALLKSVEIKIEEFLK